MMSKSFNLKHSPADKGKQNKSFDFVALYKTAAETNSILNKSGGDQKNSSSNTNTDVYSKDNSIHKSKKKSKKEAIGITSISIDGSLLTQNSAKSSPVRNPQITSTPKHTSVKEKNQVKSIMKTNSMNSDDNMDGSKHNISSSKPKKRNKSVSFMLDDNEEMVIKKTKSEDSLKVGKGSSISKSDKKKKLKKLKISELSEKENKLNGNPTATESTAQNKLTENKKQTKNTSENDVPNQNKIEGQKHQSDKKKKYRKIYKLKSNEPEVKPEILPTEINNTDNEQLDKNKKNKKKKRKSKPQVNDSVEVDGEPVTKSRKKNIQPELVAEDLENLSIGENAHTLTSLLDEMTVVDKEKRKQLKQKHNNDKKNKAAIVTETNVNESDGEKEKVKWKKRKWNKDKKGEVGESNLETTIIVEELPISMILTYKKLLAEHFAQYGLIKKIGVAEVYTTEESNTTFSTTVQFYSDGAAQEALVEDNRMLEQTFIKVKRSPHPTQTTLVVRSYGELSEQALCSTFTSVGRIRSIRLVIKGKRSMNTAFVEFDGPEAVEQAIKMAAANMTKIGGKKIHVAKFQVRKKKENKENKAESEDENSDNN